MPVKIKGGKRPAAYDAARLAGVSQSAVSRALTPGASISPELREKVMEAAQQLGYRPNLLARSLIKQRSRLIGVAMAPMENPFYPTMLEILSEGFAAAGYRILFFAPGPSGDPDPALDEVLRFQVEAVILASTRLTSQFIEKCTRAHVPLVLCNRRTDHKAVTTVTGQNVLGGRTIGEFLLAGSHRSFAYVAGMEETSTSREREQGFRQALRRAGRKLSHRVVGHYDFAAAQAAARTLFSARDRPDAVFCANDQMALAVMQTARSYFGLDVGRAVSIVGFDDIALASWPAFQLTTFSQQLPLMAQRVIEVTLKLIEGDAVEPVHDVVPGKLIVRTSARLPPEGWTPSNA